MDLNKYTQKSQEAILSAQQLAPDWALGAAHRDLARTGLAHCSPDHILDNPLLCPPSLIQAYLTSPLH